MARDRRIGNVRHRMAKKYDVPRSRLLRKRLRSLLLGTSPQASLKGKFA